MVEIAEPIDAVMAIQAGRTKSFHVLGHEFGPAAFCWITPSCVAIYTPLKIKACFKASIMTVLANQRVALVILKMPAKIEAGMLIVLERFPIQEGWRPIVLVMAILTTRRKHSYMNLRFSMANCTINRGATERFCGQR